MSLKIENLFSVRGKIALVTGGSRGLGETIARAFVENGVKTYISSRNAEACAQVAEELSQLGECIALPADISRMEEISRLGDELALREKSLDILVNNAGATWGASIDTFPESGWDKVMDLNVKSVFFLTQKLLPMLEAAGSREEFARVINIGSIEGIHVPDIEYYSYSSSKAAVQHLTRHLAKYLAPRNIAVNGIAPGFFPTKMTDSIKDKHLPKAIERTPMRRIGAPHDMAGLALYLASKASSFVCGAVVPCDGGYATTA